ncbi:MAG: ATP-binding protein [Desulfatirhabdiaceae bacterium]
MKHNRSVGWLKDEFLWPVVVLTAMLSLIVGLSVWVGNQMAINTEAEMRLRLLQQTQEVADSLNPELVRKLTFTLVDKGTPAYERLCEQMRSAGRTLLQRGIYSMAMRDGKIVFGPENYPEDDPMASPPGTEYRQPSATVLRIFKDRIQMTEGPITDEYGTFVSALVPVFDPFSGEMMMVVGVDILAGDWQASLNSVRRRPLLGALLLMILFVLGFVIIRRRNRRARPETLTFKVWIVVPTAAVMIIGLVLFGVYDYRKFNEDSLRDMRRIAEQANREWNLNIASVVQLLKMEIDHIDFNPAIQNFWEKQDIAALAVQAQPIFEQLNRGYRITHFYFIAPDRTSILRMHQPDRRGDIINRNTLLIAERTGEDSWGMELGPLGTYTLRYVRPWKQNGIVTGFLELGMEIEHLTGLLSRNTNLEVMTIIRKQYITREQFETGRQIFQFSGQWDAYPDFVVINQTNPNIPGDVVRWLEHDHSPAKGSQTFDARQGEKRFACGVIHLPDAAGRSVSDIIVMRDMTAEAGAARSSLLLNMGLVTTLFGSVLILLWSLTGAAEEQLGIGFTQLQESETRFRTLFETANDAILLMADGMFVECNSRALEIYGCDTKADLLDATPMDFSPATQPNGRDSGVATQEYIQSAQNGKPQRFYWRHCTRNGTPIDVDVSLNSLTLEGKPYVQAIVRDITEQKRIESEKRKLEEQLQHAQKIESVGRLAGGVAHDLNNLLTPIIGYSEILLDDTSLNDLLKKYVEQIIGAGLRAKDLVHQLLAFSRRQVLEFKPVDLNRAVADFEKLLRHTIREDIAIRIIPDPALPYIQGDIGQLEQVIMNLAVNAQDAMPEGGDLIIETAVAVLDVADTVMNQDLEPGRYVMLAISDGGDGMDAGTQARLFEPFFTTKEMGKGTGLGLATVYGIVKQHGGNILVTSEPGKGATFKIYLPVMETAADLAESIPDSPGKLRGAETILLVEDNQMVRDIARDILQYQGYTVLPAENGKAALSVLENHDGPVHLLLTDVVMPQMNGRDLAARAAARYPDLKVLYMSGYTDDVIAHRGILDEGVLFIQKPFSVQSLTAKVREALSDSGCEP